MADCMCGCGQDAGVFPRTDNRQSQTKGEPRRYIQGHNRRAPLGRTEKACSRCGKSKPLSEFYPRAPRPNESRATWGSMCKQCHSTRYRERPSEVRDRYAAKAWERLYMRRAERFGVEPTVETFTKDDVVATYGDCCAYCQAAPFEELDHVIAVSKGGPHTLANVRPSCVRCNRSKHDDLHPTPRHAKEPSC